MEPWRGRWLVRPRRALLAPLLCSALLLCLLRAVPLSFASARHGEARHASRLRGRRTAIERRAGGFNYAKSKGEARGFSDEEASKEKKPSAKASKESKGETGIVKDKRSRQSKALSTSKLKDMREKTLALRQKREEELDEYEEGRAMIAKYGEKVMRMPEPVAKRAAKRGMVIGGSFYFTMLLVFAFGIFLFKTQEIVIPPTLMAFVTLLLLGLAIFGSSYGLMSASWDQDREGSVLGTEEFSKNMKVLGEGFRRGVMQNEYDKAIVQRNERQKLLEAKEKKKTELLNK